MWPFSGSNNDVVAQKLRERSLALESKSKEQSANNHFLRATAQEIVSRIEEGEWTASEVLEAYIARASLAHERTNCLTEVFFPRARQRASELDAEFSVTRKLRGPLHGVPYQGSMRVYYLSDPHCMLIPTSVRTVDIEGIDSTNGYSQWSNKPAVQNADIVDKLLEAGAIPYVKTNVPQSMLVFECYNPIWGRTLNPYNDAYTCGGGSGGEAALIAMDGSPVGIGSDIGGSLRIPAAYCGIYSLKPASGRVSGYGARVPVKGFDVIPNAVGPLGRSVADLELISRIVFGSPGTDHEIPPLPFREVTLPKKLKFGYYTSDNFIKASPACQRAVLQTVDALRKSGHECVEFNFPGGGTACNIFVGLTSADAYKTMLSHLGPDRKVNALFLPTLGPRIPSLLRDFAAWIIETFVGDKFFADALRSSRRKGVGEFWKINEEKNQYRRQFQKLVWETHDFDAIIGPVQAVPQLPHGGCDNFSALAVGTIVYNVLDLPAGTLPVTRVDPSLDALTEEWFEGPGHGSHLMETGIFKGNDPLHKPETLDGMPVSIQVVCKKWEEEKLLRIMSLIDQTLSDRGFGPGAWSSESND